MDKQAISDMLVSPLRTCCGQLLIAFAVRLSLKKAMERFGEAMDVSCPWIVGVSVHGM